MFTKLGVDSSSRFSFKARTHTKLQAPLVNLPTHRLPLEWLTRITPTTRTVQTRGYLQTADASQAET